MYFVEGLNSPVWEETVHDLKYHRLIEEGDEYTWCLDWDADESGTDTESEFIPDSDDCDWE